MSFLFGFVLDFWLGYLVQVFVRFVQFVEDTQYRAQKRTTLEGPGGENRLYHL